MIINTSANILTALSLKGLGPSKVKKLVDQCQTVSLDDLFEIANKYLGDMPNESEWNLLREKYLDKLKQSLEKEIKIIPYVSNEYPSLLRHINDLPLVLFVKGNISSINQQKSIAIVGTRNPSQYTIDHGSNICNLISSNVESVISGLALGCDTIAHNSAIDQGKSTVAVLPNGLDSIYPKENSFLAQKIIEHEGALVSEYPIGNKPTRYQFVARDRIQAGLSKVGFLLESSIKGGSMHCINKLKKLNRTVGYLEPPKESKKTISWSGNNSVSEYKDFFEVCPDINEEKINLLFQKFFKKTKGLEFDQKNIFDC